MNNLFRLKMLYRLAFETKVLKIFSFHDCLPDVFSRYAELLIYKRYRILGAQDLCERMSSGSRLSQGSLSSGKEAILTFDDGRRNCWTVIFPLLKKYKIKAMFFVIPSRVSDAHENFPNLEDYWKGKVSWENLYLSHRKQPYLTWKELEIMQASGLVNVFSHSLRHDVANVSSRVIDFQHPGVYEMPVYFDEWFQTQEPVSDSLWGVPIYERAWVPLVANSYVPDKKADIVMNEFVKKNGGFLFFKKKDWRKKLFEYFFENKKNFGLGHYKKIDNKELIRPSVFESKQMIEDRLKNTCSFFSLPLYQTSSEVLSCLKEAGYQAVFSGPQIKKYEGNHLPLLSRIPSFWIQFLSYF